ncbi:isoaspartyl peptidase/L-asparaginase family protein [Chitinimonas lacunae]|uniref:Isoaspartyl peptidase/L-asparaginase family protein n=1 Tax=Chitinimonas lacunae TaxID=1963018 RepID=A0ABV8MN85_9NEIS
MPYALALHGGAGIIRRTDMPADLEAAYRTSLAAALDTGLAILSAGGPALDAVEACVIALEDNPLFNAGHGAVFNLAGEIELEAAVMDGSSQLAGTVTGVRRAKNPVRLARAVMERTPHVSIGFAEADCLAAQYGLECVEPDYFVTESRRVTLQAELARLAAGRSEAEVPDHIKHGTVGAVALDMTGRLAAATSTGGRTAKMAGRIGDTPILGAGTWADQRVAVSGTGHGEYFMRYAVAHDIAARVRYLGQDIASAAGEVMAALREVGGSGGVIAIDWQGRIAMPFNCEGMYRAMADAAGQRLVAIDQQ